MVWDLVEKCTIQAYLHTRASGSDEGARPERNQNVKHSIRPRTRNRSETRRKKSRVDKAQRSRRDILSKKLPAGSEAGGGSRLREKWAHRLLWRDPVCIPVQVHSTMYVRSAREHSREERRRKRCSVGHTAQRKDKSRERPPRAARRPPPPPR